MQTSSEISHELWEIGRRLNDVMRNINLACKEHSKAANHGEPNIKLMVAYKNAALMSFEDLKRYIDVSNNDKN